MPGTCSPLSLYVPLCPFFSIISALHPLRRKPRCVIYKPRPLGTSRWRGSLGWRVLGVASPVPQWLRYIPSRCPRADASEGCAAWPGSQGALSARREPPRARREQAGVSQATEERAGNALCSRKWGEMRRGLSDHVSSFLRRLQWPISCRYFSGQRRGE